MQNDLANRILAFAVHLDSPGGDPRAAAQSRRWLDDRGTPTKDGLALLNALSLQDQTRSVFRFVP